MKRRHRQLLNLLSLGLLLFALYLNFIKKENDDAGVTVAKGSTTESTSQVKHESMETVVLK